MVNIVKVTSGMPDYDLEWFTSGDIIQEEFVFVDKEYGGGEYKMDFDIVNKNILAETCKHTYDLQYDIEQSLLDYDDEDEEFDSDYMPITKQDAYNNTIEMLKNYYYGGYNRDVAIKLIDLFQSEEKFPSEVEFNCVLFECLTGKPYEYSKFQSNIGDTVFIYHPSEYYDLAKDVGAFWTGDVFEVHIAELSDEEASRFNFPEDLEDEDILDVDIMDRISSYYATIPNDYYDKTGVCRYLDLKEDETYFIEYDGTIM